MTSPLALLHANVDARASAVARHHGARLSCRAGCASCCSDGLEVFRVEAERIRERYPEVLRSSPGPEGRCAFLDEADRCRVYEARPYVCRSQGLPLRWIDGDAEHRDICPLNEPGPDLVSLPEEACFELGPFEGQLATLQATTQGVRPGGQLERVALRALFEGAG